MKSAVDNNPEAEVLIVGGGPAGSALARQLALWGHSVTVLTRPPPKHPALAESLPPSCRKLFDLLDATEPIEAAGFYRSRGNTVWWGTGTARSESFADGTAGYQVLRSDFDRVMLSLAEAAGAQVHTDATVRRVRRDRPTSVVVEYDTGDGSHRRRARFAADCSGRTGIIAREGLRRHVRHQTTLALAGVWRSQCGWELDDESHTLVETYQDGWAWSVPLSPRLRYFTVMVDPRRTALQPSKSPETIYDAELSKTRRFKELVAQASRRQPVWGCDASLYSAHRFAGPQFLLVGDAASFIDPLTSFGVKKALASAWTAAVVIHTCLEKPAMCDVAVEYFCRREQQMYAGCVTESAGYFAEAVDEHPHPFWTGRSTTLDPEISADENTDVEALRQNPDVQAAFTSLRQNPVTCLRPAGQLQIEKRAAIHGHEVVLEDCLLLSCAPTAVRYLRDVDLLKLLRLAESHSKVPDLFEAYNRTRAPVTLPDFLGALSVLLASGALTNDTGSPRKV